MFFIILVPVRLSTVLNPNRFSAKQFEEKNNRFFSVFTYSPGWSCGLGLLCRFVFGSLPLATVWEVTVVSSSVVLLKCWLLSGVPSRGFHLSQAISCICRRLVLPVGLSF